VSLEVESVGQFVKHVVPHAGFALRRANSLRRASIMETQANS